jgi:hypothetical protein
MTTRFFLSIAVLFFLGIADQTVNASGAFEDDPNWSSALKLVASSTKLGNAAPEAVLRRLAETHGVSGVMDLEGYGLLNDFVSSEVKLLGTEDFVQNPHQVLEDSEVSIYEEPGGTKNIVITVYQPTQELSVTDTLNAFFTEKLPALQTRFTATTIQELRRVSGVEDSEIDSLEGAKISLATQQYEWLKTQFNRASNEDEKGLCTVGAICVMGMCPTSSDRMFFETTWAPWGSASDLLQRSIEGLANHPDDFVKAPQFVVEEIEYIESDVEGLKELLNSDLDSIDGNGRWNRFLANTWVGLQNEDFINQSILKSQMRLFFVSFKLMSENILTQMKASQGLVSWDVFDSARDLILPAIKKILLKLPSNFEPKSLLEIRKPTVQEYLLGAEDLEAGAREALTTISEEGVPGWVGTVQYILGLRNQI